MARFGVADADKYGGQGGAGYFSLKDDGDVAQVRFLFDSIEDVEGFAVHEVELDGKKRYVNCLKEYGQPVDVCPFCAAKMFTQVKYFIPLYNEEQGKIQTWERGKQFGKKLSSLCARYPHLVSHLFEIERNGKSGDQKTTYEVYPVDGGEPASLEDFDVPEVLGTLVLDKSADELQFYLDNGCFPNEDGGANRRHSTQDEPAEERPTGRRTPAGSRRDKF